MEERKYSTCRGSCGRSSSRLGVVGGRRLHDGLDLTGILAILKSDVRTHLDLRGNLRMDLDLRGDLQVEGLCVIRRRLCGDLHMVLLRVLRWRLRGGLLPVGGGKSDTEGVQTREEFRLKSPVVDLQPTQYTPEIEACQATKARHCQEDVFFTSTDYDLQQITFNVNRISSEYPTCLQPEHNLNTFAFNSDRPP